MSVWCPKCESDLDPIRFAKDKRKKSGLDGVCKSCRRKYRQANKASELARWRRNYNDLKHKARMKARRNLSAKDFICAVIGCEKQGEELAHLDYTKPIDVIPMCEPHHTMLDKK